ncbi:Flavin-linked sulfhydryl oxidase of the mitochondrial IMS [Umbelopsis sp. WA50703]
MTVETDTTGKTDLKDASGAKHGTDSGMSIYIDPVTGQKIPMKDGKPCRTCIDMKTWKRLGKAAAAKDAAEDKKPSENAKEAAIKSAAETNTTTTNVPLEADNDWRRKNCPPDVEALGSSTWTLLHTMAAYYPERPAPSQMDSMKMFFEGFAQHYPCWFCKDDFQKSVAANPIQVGSRKKLSQWLCDRHNEVNEKLGKPKFDCTKVFQRWLEGPPDGKCD